MAQYYDQSHWVKEKITLSSQKSCHCGCDCGQRCEKHEPDENNLKNMRYHQVIDGEWIQPRRKNYYMKCCDCGLVHKVDFRLVKRGNGFSIQFKPKRIK